MKPNHCLTAVSVNKSNTVQPAALRVSLLSVNRFGARLYCVTSTVLEDGEFIEKQQWLQAVVVTIAAMAVVVVGDDMRLTDDDEKEEEGEEEEMSLLLLILSPTLITPPPDIERLIKPSNHPHTRTHVCCILCLSTYRLLLLPHQASELVVIWDYNARMRAHNFHSREPHAVK